MTMTWLEFGTLNKYLLPVLILPVWLSFTFRGAHCELGVSPVGPLRVNALAGSSVTLSVSFSGAADPVVTWFMGKLHVVTWPIGSGSSPYIAENIGNVIKLESNGSLTFVNVTLEYSNNYTVELTKSGMSRAEMSFTLRVFEMIQNVTLSTDPAFVQEGSDRFAVQINMLRGVTEQQTWFFNGLQLKTDSQYLVEQRSLMILGPNRSHTGWYTVLLTNPFISVTSRIYITVLYGPDEPKLKVDPDRPFYVPGDSLSLSCRAEGFPPPTAKWEFGGQTLFTSNNGVINLTNVQTSQGGVYTCTLLNKQTAVQRQKNMTLYVYERPSGNPMCSVQSAANSSLQFDCRWPGGSPQAQLSFPALSNTSAGLGHFSLTATATENLNGRMVTCFANHTVEKNNCSVTARGPAGFVPAVSSTVDSEDNIVVTIGCVSEASPQAEVSWSKGSEALSIWTGFQISNDTTQLQLRDRNVSNFLLQNYTCTCRNPLGVQTREIQLQGPSISDSNLLPNKDGTVVTLTWEIPAASVVTGFDVDMMGPQLLSSNGSRIRGSANRYRTIQQKPASARSTEVFALDPYLTYQFRIVPKARMTAGKPSKVHRRGPGQGLSGPGIAGVAAGIPCGLLFLVLLGGLVYLYVHHKATQSRQTPYPVSRAAERKTKPVQSDVTSNPPVAARMTPPPDYSRFQQTPSQRSVALPTFVPPPPMRVATML